MRQFRKGRRLIALCEQKVADVQRALLRMQSERSKLLEQITQCENELRSLAQALIGLHINDARVTRADIYLQRKQQAIFLHQRLQVDLERNLHLENLADLDLDIEQFQKQLAVLKRKEMKFIKWTRDGRRQWQMQQDSVADDESQEMLPWLL